MARYAVERGLSQRRASCLCMTPRSGLYYGSRRERFKTGRHLQHGHVKAVLRELITRYGTPRAIRSDNDSELLAEALQEEIDKRGIQLANIEPGKPWQNGSNESFNGTFRKECLNAEVFASLTEARVVIEQWRCRYNERRPHSSQKYITPEMAYFGLHEIRKT